jgi:tRNA U54 and U55 pseudouridine synthase Pus10
VRRLGNCGENKEILECLERINCEVCLGRLEVVDELIDRVLDMVYHYNFNICLMATQILYNIVSKFPERTANKYNQIEDVIIDKMSDLK